MTRCAADGSVRGTLAGLALSALTLAVGGSASAAQSCRGLVEAMLEVERCERPALMRHLCSGMSPDAFKARITSECRPVRDRVRPCIVRRHVELGVEPALARDGAAQELDAATALQVGIYTARFEGRLREPAFTCPKPDGGPGRR